MANIYLRNTDGSDASDGLTWANAKATMVAAVTAAGAGGLVYVSDNHAETQATAMAIASPGTAIAPVLVLCVDDTGNPEPPTTPATTATVTTTGTSNMSFTGHAYFRGITFNVGTGASALTLNMNPVTTIGLTFHDCTLKLVGTSASNAMNFGGSSGSASQRIRLLNSALVFSGVGQDILWHRVRLEMEGGSIAATGSVPTALITTTNVSPGHAYFRGVNLSAFGSGTTLCDMDTALATTVQFIDCSVGSGVTLTGGFSGPGAAEVWLDNCDSGDTNYRLQRSTWEGTVYSETTIVRTGGFNNGITAQSRRMVTVASTASLHYPLRSPFMYGYNETTGSPITITVEILHDGATALNDNQVWLEVQFLGTSGLPLGVWANDSIAHDLATPSAQTSSSATWTTTGLTTPNKQKLSVTVTPREVGAIHGRICLGKSSQTIYYDPLMVIT